MNSEEEILGKLLGIIENAENEEEIENGVKSIASEYGNMNSNQSNYGLNQNTTVDFYNKLTNVLKENQNDFKNMILNDSDMIIKLFCNVKDIAENMNNNKRGIDAISNQTLM